MYKLPDGSECCTASLPLPKDHWLYADHPNISPMPFRAGTNNALRSLLIYKIREAAKYAIRTATMNGKEMDFDPDALIQNLITGMLGYNTPTALSSYSEYNPDPIPPTLESVNYKP